MSKIVVDASVALAWCFPDEGNRYADEVLGVLSDHQAVEPAIWGLELANAVLVGERRNRIQALEIERFIQLLSGLNIIEDAPRLPSVFLDVLSLARKCAIAVYDAAYLEVAIRNNAPLATLDHSLQRAARAVGVPSFAP